MAGWFNKKSDPFPPEENNAAPLYLPGEHHLLGESFAHQWAHLITEGKLLEIGTHLLPFLEDWTLPCTLESRKQRLCEQFALPPEEIQEELARMAATGLLVPLSKDRSNTTHLNEDDICLKKASDLFGLTQVPLVASDIFPWQVPEQIRKFQTGSPSSPPCLADWAVSLLASDGLSVKFQDSNQAFRLWDGRSWIAACFGSESGHERCFLRRYARASPPVLRSSRHPLPPQPGPADSDSYAWQILILHCCPYAWFFDAGLPSTRIPPPQNKLGFGLLLAYGLQNLEYLRPGLGVSPFNLARLAFVADWLEELAGADSEVLFRWAWNACAYYQSYTFSMLGLPDLSLDLKKSSSLDCMVTMAPHGAAEPALKNALSSYAAELKTFLSSWKI